MTREVTTVHSTAELSTPGDELGVSFDPNRFRLAKSINETNLGLLHQF